MGLFDSAIGLLSGQTSATEGPIEAGPTSVTATLEGRTQSINFGDKGTNWIVIGIIVLAIFLLRK